MGGDPGAARFCKVCVEKLPLRGPQRGGGGGGGWLGKLGQNWGPQKKIGDLGAAEG